jgi:hypothetical protein
MSSKVAFQPPRPSRRAYDDADLNRAVQDYRFFYPTLSAVAMAEGVEPQGTRLTRGALRTTARAAASSTWGAGQF